MKKTIEKRKQLEQGSTYLVIIEWDACTEQEPEDWDEAASGAYEVADAVAYEELAATIDAAEEEAKDILDSNGSGWVSVLIGEGECVDDLDCESAYMRVTIEP